MGQAVPFIRQLGSAAVGGCGNSGPALAALDDTDGDMTKIYAVCPKTEIQNCIIHQLRNSSKPTYPPVVK